MNTKFLKHALILLFVSLLFAGSALWLTLPKEKHSLGGEPVFANTLHNLSHLGRLTIEKNGVTTNLQLEDNLWRVMEIGNYYAGYKQINNLFNTFKDARIYRRKNITTEDEKHFGLDENSLRITTSDQNGQILNSIQIGKAATDNLYHFSKIEGEKGIFLITGNFNIPDTAISWLQQPLLSIPSTDIRSLRIGNYTASRPNIIAPFTVKEKNEAPNTKRYIKTFGLIAAYDACRAADFDFSQYTTPKSLSISTFDGLIINLKIYNKADQEYWASLNFSTTPLPTTAVSDYIKSNAFLYEDWYFKLDTDVGRILYNAFLYNDKLNGTGKVST